MSNQSFIKHSCDPFYSAVRSIIGFFGVLNAVSDTGNLINEAAQKQAAKLAITRYYKPFTEEAKKTNIAYEQLQGISGFLAKLVAGLIHIPYVLISRGLYLAITV